MTEHEFSILVAAMKSVYSDPKFIADSFAAKTWYSLLKDISYKDASNAVERYMSTRHFPPTVADIKEMCYKNENYDMNELEAWAIVYRAICNSGYYYQEEFEKLPKTIQKTIRDPRMLYEWSQLGTEEVQTVIKSNFEKTYKTECARQQEFGQMPEKIQQLIIETERKMIQAEKPVTREQDAFRKFEPLPTKNIKFIEEEKDKEPYKPWKTIDELNDRVKDIWRKKKGEKMK